MKKIFAIIGFCLANLTLNMACKASDNKYETDIDKGLALANPEYYLGLKKILTDFQNHLVEQNIVVDNDPKNYIQLLKKIRGQNKNEFDITYPLRDSLNGLNKLLKSDILVLSGTNESSNILNSKESQFQAKMYEFIKNQKEINNSVIANVMLEVYDADDYNVPYIKVKLFKFLDPNSDFVLTSYIGKPSTE
tara:strand:- start:52 stop:627 length:576 start_codon:yes stop_codon:yes gene_type:complete